MSDDEDDEYPDRMAVLKSIVDVESNLDVLKNFVDSYVEIRDKSGPKDALAIEFSKSYLIPKEAELELSRHELAAHLPKMLAAGDQAKALVERNLQANDTAAAYDRELKEKLCPELFHLPEFQQSATPGNLARAGEKADSISVKTMTDKLITIQAAPSDTIASIKARYQDSEGVPPDQQRLISKGKELKDEATLEESHVVLGDTIHIVLRLRQVEVKGAGTGGGCCSLQ